MKQSAVSRSHATGKQGSSQQQQQQQQQQGYLALARIRDSECGTSPVERGYLSLWPRENPRYECGARVLMHLRGRGPGIEHGSFREWLGTPKTPVLSKMCINATKRYILCLIPSVREFWSQLWHILDYNLTAIELLNTHHE